MIELLVFFGMLLCAVLPFSFLTKWMRAGQSGLALSVASITGAVLVILIYASGRPFGIDPMIAMAVAMLVCVPAFLGSLFGLLLGWLMRRRDDKKV
ncbi:MAG: UDP-N-acetylmuramate--alanine ligase [Yoonia sp.]|uniref:UDP-N-acetylmuramate--alanine ligase n=1 Tax=Yoonia sp. TaxID=2212373 RepID=UPI003EF34285